MLKNIRMGTVILNQSNFDKSDFELLNASHSPSLILLEEDVDLGGNTLYFVPGDVLRANGGTLGGGQIRGVVSIEDTCQQLFRLDDNGKCTVEFSYIIDKGKNANEKKIENIFRKIEEWMPDDSRLDYERCLIRGYAVEESEEHAKAIKVAKGMLQSGKLLYEEIAEIAELSIDEVKALDEGKPA